MTKLHNSNELIITEIPGFNGAYKAANKGGIIISSARTIKHGHGLTSTTYLPEKVMKTRKNNKGYSIINLQQNGVKKRFLVSRLIAETFVPNPLNLPCVNHLDAIIENNDASNFEWCTVKENAIHASKMGLLYSPKGEKNKLSKLTNEEARQIRSLKNVSSKILSELYGVSRTVINKIKRNETYKNV